MDEAKLLPPFKKKKRIYNKNDQRTLQFYAFYKKTVLQFRRVYGPKQYILEIHIHTTEFV